MDALRQFRRAATFRVAMQDLTGRLPLMQVSDRLTDVAELIVEQALALAWRHTVCALRRTALRGRRARAHAARRHRRLRQARRHGARLRLRPRPRVPARLRGRAAADGGPQGRGQRGLLPAPRAAARAPADRAHGRPAGCTRSTCGCALPARAGSRSRRSAPSRTTSGARPGPGSTRRCCTRAGSRAIRRSARPTAGSAARVLRRGREARDAARRDRRDARAHARGARAGRAKASSTSSRIAAASPTSSSWRSTGCSGTCASTRRSPSSRTRSATSSRWARRRSSTTG